MIEKTLKNPTPHTTSCSSCRHFLEGFFLYVLENSIIWLFLFLLFFRRSKHFERQFELDHTSQVGFLYADIKSCCSTSAYILWEKLTEAEAGTSTNKLAQPRNMVQSENIKEVVRHPKRQLAAQETRYRGFVLKRLLWYKDRVDSCSTPSIWYSVSVETRAT